MAASRRGLERVTPAEDDSQWITSKMSSKSALPSRSAESIESEDTEPQVTQITSSHSVGIITLPDGRQVTARIYGYTSPIRCGKCGCPEGCHQRSRSPAFPPDLLLNHRYLAASEHPDLPALSRIDREFRQSEYYADLDRGFYARASARSQQRYWDIVRQADWERSGRPSNKRGRPIE